MSQNSVGDNADNIVEALFVYDATESVCVPEIKRSKRKCFHFYSLLAFIQWLSIPISSTRSKVGEGDVVGSSSSHHRYFHFSEKNIVKYLNVVEKGVKIDIMVRGTLHSSWRAEDSELFACGDRVTKSSAFSCFPFNSHIKKCLYSSELTMSSLFDRLFQKNGSSRATLN